MLALVAGLACPCASPATKAVTDEPSCSTRTTRRSMVDRAAAADHAIAGRLPHLAGPEPGVLEAVDQRLDDLALAAPSEADQGARARP